MNGPEVPLRKEMRPCTHTQVREEIKPDARLAAAMVNEIIKEDKI